MHKNLRIFSFIAITVFTACRSNTPTSGINSLGPDTAEVSVTEVPFEFPQASCGDDIPGDTEVWWRVYIDDGNLENIRTDYCNDAFVTTRNDTGVEAIQVASFNNRERAEAFAQEIGGSIGQVGRERDANEDSQLVRFEYTRSRSSDGEREYTPYNTNCNASEIEEYISKSISGGSEASPFVDEFSALLACGSEAVPDLIEIVQTGDAHARFNATIALGEMGAVANNDEVVPVLINIIKNDPNPLIRVKAIGAVELISPPTEPVTNVLSEAQNDSEIVPGSDLNPRAELLPVSEFANDALWRMGQVDLLPDGSWLKDNPPEPREPEYRDASCPVKYVWWDGYSTEYREFYRLDSESNRCIMEGTDRPPATGGDYIIKSFCELFNCRKD